MKKKKSNLNWCYFIVSFFLSFYNYINLNSIRGGGLFTPGDVKFDALMKQISLFDTALVIYLKFKF